MTKRAYVVLAGVLIACGTAHCGSDSDGGAAGGGAGGASGGTGGSTGGSGGTAGSAGSATGGSAGTSGAAGTGGQAGGAQDGYTSATCGAIPIMGVQWPSITEDCTACVNQACCDEGLACGDDAECKALRDCYAACADSDCYTTCTNAHPNGVAGSDAFASCRATGCPQACANLSCVGSVQWNTPSDATYDLTVSFYELQSGSYLPDLDVKACALDDAACAAPLATGTTDSSGKVMMTVPSATQGIGVYFEVTGASVTPTLAYLDFTDNVTSFKTGTFISPVLSASTTTLLASLMQVTLDPARGHVLFQVRDCTHNPFATGSVEVEQADAQSTTAYMKGSMPSTTATGTDPGGQGAVLNVPAGNATVLGYLEQGGTPFSEFSVVVRAGYMTTMNVVPTP